MELSVGCKEFININVACNAEIEEHCSSNYFHGDTMTCLTQWTSQDVLGSGCKAALPAVEEADEKVDKEKEEWKAKRKAGRKASIDAIEKEKNGGEKKKKLRGGAAAKGR